MANILQRSERTKGSSCISSKTKLARMDLCLCSGVTEHVTIGIQVGCHCSPVSNHLGCIDNNDNDNDNNDSIYIGIIITIIIIIRTLGQRRPVTPISFAENIHVRLQCPIIWWMEAVEPSPIWCIQVCFGPPGGLLQPDGGVYLGMVSIGTFEGISSRDTTIRPRPKRHRDPGDNMLSSLCSNYHKYGMLLDHVMNVEQCQVALHLQTNQLTWIISLPMGCYHLQP